MAEEYTVYAVCRGMGVLYLYTKAEDANWRVSLMNVLRAKTAGAVRVVPMQVRTSRGLHAVKDEPTPKQVREWRRHNSGGLK
jgi:hypothetical protein